MWVRPWVGRRDWRICRLEDQGHYGTGSTALACAARSVQLYSIVLARILDSSIQYGHSIAAS
jgi:hypothetical protein